MKIRIVSTPKLGFKDWDLNVQGSRIYGVKVEGLTVSGARDSIPSYSFLSGRYLKAVKGVHALISDIPLHYEDFEAFGGCGFGCGLLGGFGFNGSHAVALTASEEKRLVGEFVAWDFFVDRASFLGILGGLK